MRHKLAVAFVIACTTCATSIAYPADETQAVTFSLNNATSREAATVLRTIAGVKNLEIDDDHTITVRDTQEKLELAAAVVKMLDATEDTADATPLTTSDGSVIVAVFLNRATSGEVIVALQKELHCEKRGSRRDTHTTL